MARTPKITMNVDAEEIELLRWALRRDFSTMQDRYFNLEIDGEDSSGIFKLLEKNLVMDERIRRLAAEAGIVTSCQNFHDDTSKDRAAWYVKELQERAES